jgi:8-oxo-dGTP pyrophosphatase MutT (NUDIX family)
VLVPASKPRQRVACYVTRDGHAGPELLVFDHVDFPEAGTQVPAGGIDPGESLGAAAVREIREETGLRTVLYDGPLGESTRPHPETGAGRATTYVHCRADDPRSSWTVRVGGAGGDEGLRFRCWWTPLPLRDVTLADHQGEFLHRI